MYDKILVPIEISHEHSGINAIKIAKTLINPDGEIVLVHVIADIPTYVATQVPVDLLGSFKKTAQNNLNKIAKEAGISSKVEIGEGPAASVILEVAESHDIDLIIIASHHPGLSDYFLGSTASRVVRHAQCSVLVDR